MYKAIQISQTGDSDVMRPVMLEEPNQLNPDEVLIRMEYAGINFIDVYFRKGIYPVPSLPFVPGKEGVGIVKAVGSNVSRFKPNDKVGFAMGFGSYAELAVSQEKNLIPIPDDIPSDTACALLLQGFTAHYLVTDTFPVKPGNNVLVHAAAGGVGQLLCRMLKLKQAKVVATVSNDAKKAIAQRCGADHVINYGESCTFKDAALEILNGEKFDVVYDSVGGTTFHQGLEVLKPRGMMALFGQSGGVVPPFDLGKLNPLGSLFVTRPSLAHHILTRDEIDRRAADVFGYVSAGKLPVDVSQVYPLEDAAKAHDDLEARRTTGKCLLKIN